MLVTFFFWNIATFALWVLSLTQETETLHNLGICFNKMFSFLMSFRKSVFFHFLNCGFVCFSCFCISDTLFWSTRHKGQRGSSSCSPWELSCPWMPTGRAKVWSSVAGLVEMFSVALCSVFEDWLLFCWILKVVLSSIWISKGASLLTLYSTC